MSAYCLSDLVTPGAKCRLQFAPDTLDALSRRCCFTDEEAAILRYRSRGMTLLEISFCMQRDFGSRSGARRKRALASSPSQLSKRTPMR